MPEPGLSRAARWCLVVDGSRLDVLLRVDRAAPWRSVHDILRRAGQSSLYKVRFLVSHGPRERPKMQAFLPTADREFAYVTACLRNGRVELDGREVDNLTEAIRTAYRALAGGDRAVAGLIDADPDVPFGDVIRALDAFACAGVCGVNLAARGIRAVVIPRG